jgi:2-oxoisovalerate dehydrogenase E1 component
LFSENRISGTTHTCIGQEFSGAVVGDCLKEGDVVFSNHRCHGHYLGLTKDFFGLGAEIIGKNEGINNGFAGSQHICIPGKFYSNGILGGMLPFAMGVSRNLNQHNITVCFLGDGCFGEGILHEALNLANVFQMPVLFFVEDNGIAQSTITNTVNKIDKKKFFECHNIEAIDVKDTNELYDLTTHTISQIRDNNRPKAIIWNCERHSAHSKGDDTRSAEEIEKIMAADYLQALCQIHSVDYQTLKLQYETEINSMLNPLLDNKSEFCLSLKKETKSERNIKSESIKPSESRMNARIGDALKSVILDKGGNIFGEDVSGEYGGAFKVTRGLSKEHPNQLINMPISEAAIIGFASGVSTSGMPTCAEIMFGDFLGLSADQIVNHLAKFGVMHNSHTPSLIIRTPIGGGRGYGATHSQNLEKMFGGIPGVTLMHISFLHDIELAFESAALNKGCTIISEPKLQYGMSIKSLPNNFNDLFFVKTIVSDHNQEMLHISSKFANSTISIITTGIMLPKAINAVKHAMLHHEVYAEIICPRTVYPLTGSELLPSIVKGKTLIIDEAHEGYGFSEYVSNKISSHSKCDALFMEYPFYPSSLSLEEQIMISDQKIIEKILEMQ